MIARDLALGALLLIGAPAAGMADSPDPGTVFIFTEGRVERFVRTEGDLQIWATRRGREYSRSAIPAEPILKWDISGRRGERRVVGNTSRLWPPETGNSARFRVLTKTEFEDRVRRSIELWSCKIEAATHVDVGGTSYDTLPIVCLRYSVNTMRPLQKRTWWWSEDVGHYVRRRYENLRDGETSDLRLCAALPAHRANPARIEAIAKRGC